MNKIIRTFLTCTVLLSCVKVQAQLFTSLDNLAMTGYQGWFNAEGDGSGLGWKHYEKAGKFSPGYSSVDLWPDVSEYQKTYKTDFTLPDGQVAKVFSSADKSTTELHFKWMKEYGIDGAFMQRFLTTLKNDKHLDNYDKILFNALKAAEKNARAISVMYDLSGSKSEDMEMLIEDWTRISNKLLKSPNYLYHNGKPLVAIWGVGFDDNRRYNYDDIQKLIDFFKNEGCSILLGVPAFWRTLSMDTLPDPRLHSLIAQIDVVHPWFVGRYNNDSYDKFYKTIVEDIKWCKERNKTYIPVVFPGFSWYNLKSGVAAPLNQIPRLGGKFLWKQIYGAISSGAKTLYLAMFDEIDEATALFKCANDVPEGFLGYEGIENDRYLYLSGMGAKVLKSEVELTKEMPKR